MPRLRKIILHNQVHFVTLSVEEGVMLPANPLVKFVIQAAMARAYKHHPLEIDHFIVNGTHIHMIVRINNPEDLPKFMERFKTESAHYLNRLLGRKKRTVWCSRYDSPALLTVSSVIDKIVYLYINPVKDGLIKSIKQYPGLSSWENYQSDVNQISSNLIARDSLFQVNQAGDYKMFNKIKKLICKSNNQKEIIKLSINGWMKSFGIDDIDEMDQVNQIIFNSIDAQEKEINSTQKKFKGRVRLENQGIDLTYQRQLTGRKVWCISSDRKKRADYISFVQALCEEAMEIYRRYSQGDFSFKYPFGLFPPRMPVVANLVCN